MERRFCRITVDPKAEKRIRSGHPWVYGEDTAAACGSYENGDLVDVVTGKGSWLGTGFVNDRSKIRVRLICRDPNQTFDEAFWERRIRYALDYRKTVCGGLSCCRLIFGEADQFPGWTLDKFGDVLVSETLSLGIERRKDLLFPILIRLLKEEGETVSVLYERNDAPVRALEGMEPFCGFYAFDGLRTDTDGTVLIEENGVRYLVDYVRGQKTGYFLDQKWNRQAVCSLSKGKRVLDCFTHTGSFALNAAFGGASSVTAVDVSEEALKTAGTNAELNGFSDRIAFVCADAFDYLQDLLDRKQKPFDLIVLDPPAFTKSGDTVKNAYLGYRRINYAAMKILPRGGYLATCSCSHFMTDGLFRSMLSDAAAAASVQLKQIEARQQGRDHPVLWSVPETAYLKFYIFQIL
ncbi:MAG: class I SAM-dependent rRNA methyltransferase [Clostridia bacterium]|nr:class I SAM-dependent rRNA methyltransferase [Clostridia bacterium]